jgi:hypothetical protein
MVLGIACCARVLWSNLVANTYCECESFVAFAGLLLYTSFLYMFSNFFYKVYLRNASFSFKLINHKDHKKSDSEPQQINEPMKSNDKCTVDDNNNDKLTNSGLVKRTKNVTTYSKFINGLF